MSTYDVGDQALLRHEVRVNGALTDATVVLAVVAPDGTASAPSVTHASLGVYTATVPVSQAGPWTYVWTMSGAVVDVAAGFFSAQNPATPVYLTVDQLKRYLGPITDALEDDLLADAIASVSREIDAHCGRRFYADSTATARLYEVDSVTWLCVDDFWTTTGLVVEADLGGGGTFSTVTSANYELHPLNGIVDGQAGWPYSELKAVGLRWPCQNYRAGIRLTAKWGWASVPAPVTEACKILASETFKLKGAPFGVASFDQFGPIRVRDNPMAAKKLGPYVRDPVLVG